MVLIFKNLGHPEKSSGADFFGVWRHDWTSSEPVTGPGRGRGEEVSRVWDMTCPSALLHLDNTNTVYERIYMEFRKMLTITLCLIFLNTYTGPFLLRTGPCFLVEKETCSHNPL